MLFLFPVSELSLLRRMLIWFLFLLSTSCPSLPPTLRLLRCHSSTPSTRNLCFTSPTFFSFSPPFSSPFSELLTSVVPFSTTTSFAALGKPSYYFRAFFFSEEDRFRVVVDIAWIHLNMCFRICCGFFFVCRRCWLFRRVSGRCWLFGRVSGI